MKWLKNNAELNLVIDAVMLVVLMAISGMGFLIKYVLVDLKDAITGLKNR